MYMNDTYVCTCMCITDRYSPVHTPSVGTLPQLYIHALLFLVIAKGTTGLWEYFHLGWKRKWMEIEDAGIAGVGETALRSSGIGGLVHMVWSLDTEGQGHFTKV